jgi:hypothetical protein
MSIDVDLLVSRALHSRWATIEYSDLCILDKRQRLVPFHPNRVQAHLLAHLTGRDLILKARQLGISTAVQAWLFKTAVSQTVRVVTFTHLDTSTTFLRAMTRLFYDQLPAAKKPKRSTANATLTEYPGTNSTIFTGTAGSPESGRAGSFSHLHGSEVAFWRNSDRLIAGVMQAIPLHYGHIVMESTANGQQGWFYERCMEALDGSTDWTLHFYPWWWDDSYAIPDVGQFALEPDERALMDEHALTYEQIAWRRTKQRELGNLFAQEYPEDPHGAFISSGSGYFQMDAARYVDGQSEPKPDHMYVAGLDFGQAHDYTVLSVIDVTALKQVDLFRVNRQSWADMRAAITRVCQKWRVHTVIAEENSIGSTNIEALRGEFDAAGVDALIQPFQTSHTSKTAIMAGLRLALEEGGLKLLPNSVQRSELAAFNSRQTASGAWILSAPDGLHDDTVMALALAWYGAIRTGGYRVETGKRPSILEI